jgi:SHS2 domain-containing protein
VRRLPVPAVAGEDGFLSFLRSAFLLLSAERFLVRSAEAFPVTGGGGWSVSLSGEEAEPSRHRFPREVKAVTRHAVEVVRLPSGLLRARFVVDV